MFMEADQLGRLRDILNAAKPIAFYVEGSIEADFRTNNEKQDAVIRRIEIIESKNNQSILKGMERRDRFRTWSTLSKRSISKGRPIILPARSARTVPTRIS